jgi:hypothetical protein
LESETADRPVSVATEAKRWANVGKAELSKVPYRLQVGGSQPSTLDI